MSIEEAVVEKLKSLSPEQQREVLDFTVFLGQRDAPKRPRKSLEGIWKGLNDRPISEEDIAEARREMWGNFSRDLPE